MDLFIGVDLGTSGCRACAIDAAGEVRAEAAAPLPPPEREGVAVQQAPGLWWEGFEAVMEALLARVPPRSIRALAVDGTSGTVFLADPEGHPLTPALMYNDGRAVVQAARIAAVAPRESAAHGTASGLAKLLWLLEGGATVGRVHTQADWIAGRLTGRYDLCDVNNALKLGYEPEQDRWPPWLRQLGIAPELLPNVVPAGAPWAPLREALARRWGLEGVRVRAGTTDSTAAIIATGASQVGEAVTSLGSTLVAKVIATRPVFAPEFGIYSQPYGGHWLVGGGSNSGGAVLRQFFTDAQMDALALQLDPETPTGLDYYPLSAPGERFPVNDPALAPRLTPRPASDALFFQGLLEGMARIERQAYERLQAVGAPYPTRVVSAGGGARNEPWRRIRERALGVPVVRAEHAEAAYGTALLAAQE